MLDSARVGVMVRGLREDRTCYVAFCTSGVGHCVMSVPRTRKTIEVIAEDLKEKRVIPVGDDMVINNDRGVHMRPMPGMMGLITSNNKDKKKAAPVKGSDVKRTRRDRGELEDIMFKLFERQPNWALKQLVQETDQPAQFLKEILNELCVYNKRGTNQGTYELKPEYKKSVEDTGAE
ncbi:UNVERIFIED_CONTAM: hypothetical protein Sangu_2308000 [Sesamum angustifolium]|uniref:TFIIF beta subunit HTH domain-containing protein n=1 Tax=Sesamum angustifolium TaxID=2727405 RepID=A0AAW2LA44_9LAMI